MLFNALCVFSFLESISVRNNNLKGVSLFIVFLIVYMCLVYLCSYQLHI